MAENSGNFSFSQGEFEDFLKVLRGAAQEKENDQAQQLQALLDARRVPQEDRQLRDMRVKLIRTLEAVRQKQADLENQVESIFRMMGVQKEKTQAEQEAQRRQQEAQQRQAEEARRLEAERKAREAELARQEEERRRQEEEARRQAEEARKAREAEARRLAEEKYRAELAAWEKACEELRPQQEKRFLERLVEEKEARERKVYEDYDGIIRDGVRRKNGALERKRELEAQLRNLGMFQFGKKEAAREEILQCQAAVEKAEREMAQADEELNRCLEAIPEQLKAMVDELRREVALEIPLPPKPQMKQS